MADSKDKDNDNEYDEGAREPEPQSNGLNLKIDALPTDKSDIKINPCMECGIIPKHPSSVMFCGKSGSGKTNLFLNLMTREHFYKDYFDMLFLFSETAGSGGDDLYQRHLPELRKDCIFKPDKKGVTQLRKIVNTQKQKIKQGGIASSPKILIIFDDVAHATDFMKSDEYLLLHIANRHLNISCFSLIQSYVKVPRSARCQVSAVMFFAGCTQSEKFRLAAEHCPAGFSEKDFISEIVDPATAERFSFLHINKHCEMSERYRKNLDVILKIN